VDARASWRPVRAGSVASGIKAFCVSANIGYSPHPERPALRLEQLV
jgi:hypothetical protein